ncbi:MAG: glycosyltransferase family 87 protein [Pseudomonadota bacterium]
MRYLLLAAKVLAAIWGLLIIAYIGGVTLILAQPDAAGESWPSDFAVFWEAARFVLAGEAARAFDLEALRAPLFLNKAAPEGWMPHWFYPPTWALLLAPLGALPFGAAFAVFTGMSLALFYLALRPASGPVPGGLVLVLASPSLFSAVFIGNTSVLLAGALAAVLWAVREERPVRAGLACALFAIKPQLAVLLPVFLAVRGRWRAFAVAAAASTAFTVLAVAVIGWEYTEAFFGSLGHWQEERQALQTEGGGTPNLRRDLITIYGFMHYWGVDHRIALPVSLVLIACVVGAVGYVAARTRSFDALAAVIAIAVPMAAARALFYETAFLLVAFVWLWRAGAASRMDGRIALFVCWFGLPRALNYFGVDVAAIWAPINLALLAWACWFALKVAPRDDVEPARTAQ